MQSKKEIGGYIFQGAVLLLAVILLVVTSLKSTQSTAPAPLKASFLLLECLMDGADQIKQAMQETEEEKQKDAEQSQRQEANRISREVLQEEGLFPGREKQGSARKHRENAPKTSE